MHRHRSADHDLTLGSSVEGQVRVIPRAYRICVTWSWSSPTGPKMLPKL